MAERAANFTFTYQNKPSIFEVIAQKSLNSTLEPALEKVALVLSTNFPRKFGFLNFYYDETFLVINGLLQYYYLRYYDSSFSENFYGLKRILVDNNVLSANGRELSLIFLVIIPYFKRKIDEKIALYRIEDAEGCLRNDIEGRFKRLMIHSHTSFELVWGLLTVYNYIQYMGDKTEFQLPILRLIGIKLMYADLQNDTNFWHMLLKGEFSWANFNLSIIKDAVSGVIGLSAFFLQFLQTWNAQQANFNLTDLPKVEPPPQHIKANAYKDKCPLCLKRWLIPTVLPVSGYIFCFRCILKHLNEHQKCPVTNLPARPLDIVRLYLNDQ